MPYTRSMATHLRFKRHLRFLRDGEVVKVIEGLADGKQLPAGEAFDHLLAALQHAPLESDARADLSQRMNVEPAMIDGLLARLFELGLVERFDPETQGPTRFDRQLLFFDALAPVQDHAENLARQQRLKDAQVLILGLGGIGHQVALSLAAAGVGRLVLVDGDVVEESNLHRQILFAASDVGRIKVEAARDGILRLAPACAVEVCVAQIGSADDWRKVISRYPDARHVMLSADRPVQLVNWISDARRAFDYHFVKCGYMNAQGLIGPLLGPDTKGYEELFASWAPLIDAQPDNIQAFNARAAAPTMAASNAIMANIAALELIKHITQAGALALFEQRLLLDLNTCSIQTG